MKATRYPGEAAYRVWIARCCGAEPADESGPPAAVALEPAEPGIMGREAAAVYVEAFNQVARLRPGRLWAVALPVSVRYDGEPKPGQIIPLRSA